MPEKVFLKPAEGLVVRDPDTGEPLPPEGAYKVLDAYWRRRIKDGDALRVDDAGGAPDLAQPYPKED